MKYFISDEYGTAFYLDDYKHLCGCPLLTDGTFDTDENFVVERPHEEVPESFYEMVEALLLTAWVADNIPL